MNSFTPPSLPDQYYLRAEIGQYSLNALKRLIKCNLPVCSKCHEASSAFTPHEVRSRTFYIITDQIKASVSCLVTRFKCPSCGQSATQLPDFALPCKRYVLPTILHFTRNYVNDDYATYRNLLRPNFIGWEDSEKHFAHTNTFRWIAALGSMPDTLARAVALKTEQPYRSDRVINRILQHEYNITVPKTTLYRHLKQAGATRLKLGVCSKKVRKRWSCDHTHDLWVGDFAEGPYVKQGDQVQKNVPVGIYRRPQPFYG